MQSIIESTGTSFMTVSKSFNPIDDQIILK